MSSQLSHYGVKGMRWGVTKSQPTGSRNLSADASRSRKIEKKVQRHGGIHALSNREIQDFVTRLNLEQQYARLNPPPPTVLDQAKRIVGAAKTTGQTMNNVLAFVNSPAGKTLRKAIVGI